MTRRGETHHSHELDFAFLIVAVTSFADTAAAHGAQSTADLPVNKCPIAIQGFIYRADTAIDGAIHNSAALSNARFLESGGVGGVGGYVFDPNIVSNYSVYIRGGLER